MWLLTKIVSKLMEKDDLLRKKKLRKFGLIQMIVIIIYVWTAPILGRTYFHNFHVNMYAFGIVYLTVLIIVTFILRPKR